jgi:hypothetical protein
MSKDRSFLLRLFHPHAGRKIAVRKLIPDHARCVIQLTRCRRIKEIQETEIVSAAIEDF